MKYNLNEIFSQAIDDNYSVRIDGNGYKSVVLYSVKIIKDNKTDEYVKKLDLIEKGIQESIKNKSPKKAIDYLRSERDRVMNKYTKINNKIK